jgi:hypothetical protein
MDRYKPLVLPGYVVASILIILPIFDSTMMVFPFNPGNALWRYGAAGLISNALIFPSIGLLLLLFLGVLSAHYRFLKWFGFACILAAVLTLIGLALFGLDAFEARSTISTAAKLGFAIASLTAAGKLTLAATVMVLAGRAALKAGRQSRQPR